jgi:hypothetical protein
MYTAFDGAETRITWQSEETYQAVKVYFKKRGIDVTPMMSGGVTTDVEFVYVETEQQYDALVEFMETLKEKGET